jgi:hypothetical protein
MKLKINIREELREAALGARARGQRRSTSGSGTAALGLGLRDGWPTLKGK